MTREITVMEGQNLHDLCLQHYGSYDGLLDLIERNAAITSVDFEPPTGMELEIGAAIDEDIVNYYIRENVVIVSNREESEPLPDRIWTREFSIEFGDPVLFGLELPNGDELILENEDELILA